MSMKLRLIYSPNMGFKKRRKNQIKFIIFHYTGMKSEKLAIKKLTNLQSGVSSHYLIKKSGEIVLMVPDLYTAWHAGISAWKRYKLLNANSIGIEISNPGHQFGYMDFSKKQIKSLIKLSKFLIRKYGIKKNNILGHSDIAPDRKKDPGEKFPWEFLSKNKIGLWYKLDKRKLKLYRGKKISDINKKLFKNNLTKFGYSSSNKFAVKAFQRRFRPALVNGQIDQECMTIINKLLNNKK